MKFIFVCFFISLLAINCSKDDDNNNVNSQDMFFMQQASFSNYNEISAGSIAASKGSYDSVRIFGSMMVADHGNAQASLDSLASSLNVPVPSTADSVHQAMATQLQSLSGNVFDTTYMGAQVRDHMLTIAIFQQEISGGNNQQVLDFARKNLPVIQMHLQEAQSIQQQVQ
jgi:putative membrane protein